MNKEILISELNFKASRSSGPGGQHVNKVSSKIILSFDLMNSSAFTELEKARLFVKLASKLTKEYQLVIHCEEGRSQLRNKEKAIEKLFDLIAKGLHVAKKRKPTKPSRSAIKRRQKTKVKNSLKKNLRKKPGTD